MDLNLIKKLREKTGAGMSACQKALEECNDNLEKATEILRKRGEKIVEKKSSRTIKAGIIGVYLHSNEKIASMIEVGCETDFVARNNEFKDLVHDLAMQVAAANPLYLKPEDIPAELINKEKEIYRTELSAKGGKGEKKPEQVFEKIIQGKLEKFYQNVCLIKQPFIKDDKVKIEDLVKNLIAKVGENIQIRKFVRFEVGN